MRPVPVLLLAATAALAAPAPSQSWGDVVTADVTLAQDLQYDGIHPVGLTVAASGVRIDLGGHRIDGLGAASVGIHVLPGVDDVTITRGLVRRNQTQILLEGHATAHSSGHLVQRVGLDQGWLGATGLALRHGSGIALRHCDDVLVEQCRFTQLEGSGVDAFGADRLTVQGCEFRGTGTGDRGGAAGAGVSVCAADPVLRENLFLLTDGPAVLLRGPAGGYAAAGGGELTRNHLRRCLARPAAGRDLGVVSVVDGWSGALVGGNVFTQYQRSLAAAAPAAHAVGLRDAPRARVVDNTLRGLPGTGGVLVGTGCADLVLAGNLIQANGAFGLRLLAGAAPVDARGNWWGAADGPSGAGAGSGDALLLDGGAAADASGWNPRPARFGLRSVLANGTEASGFALGDLDLDGDPDLVTALDGSGTLAVHQNVQGRFFGPGPAFPAGLSAGRPRVAPLDAGFAPDVVVGDPVGGAVVVLAGDGAGGLGPPQVVPIGVAPVAAVPGDLDGDGWLDLLVVDPGWVFQPGELLWLRNDKNGGWIPAAAPASGPGAWEDAALVDLDGDGDLDLVAADAGSLYPVGPRRLLLRFNDGLGSFSGDIELAVPFDPRRLVVTDLDGDGNLDVAVAGIGEAGEAGGVAWYAGLPGGGLAAAVEIRGGLHAPSAITAADADGDDVPDLVVADTALGRLVVLSGPDPAVAVPETVGSGASLLEVLAADVDGDSRLDLLALEPQRGVLDHRQLQRPFAEYYGAGCGGGSGLAPTIGHRGEPYRDNPNFVVTLSGAAPLTPAYLLGGRTAIADPYAGGCTLLVGNRFNPIFLAVTDANGNAELSFWFNPEARFISSGIHLYGQWAVLDPGGGALGKWALSDAIHVLPGE